MGNYMKFNYYLFDSTVYTAWCSVVLSVAESVFGTSRFFFLIFIWLASPEQSPFSLLSLYKHVITHRGNIHSLSLILCIISFHHRYCNGILRSAFILYVADKSSCAFNVHQPLCGVDRKHTFGKEEWWDSSGNTEPRAAWHGLAVSPSKGVR